MNPYTDDSAVKPSPDGPHVAWWRELTRYHWFVFLVASLGWLFDTMDQQLFNLARKPAVTELLHVTAGDPATAGKVGEYAGYTTTIFMIGWAMGGHLLRHPRRQDRPGEDHDADGAGLLGLHRPERALGGRLGLRALPIPDRPGRRRRVRRRRGRWWPR